MKIVAWLSGRKKINPEQDTPAVSVVVVEPTHRAFIRENLEEQDGRYMHIDVFGDFAHDTEDRNLVEFVAQAAQYTDWVHIEEEGFM